MVVTKVDEKADALVVRLVVVKDVMWAAWLVVSSVASLVV